MAKAPRQGEVKTRLVPPLTAAEATELSAAFIRDTAENILAAAKSAAIEGYVAYSPPGSAAAFAGVVPAGLGLLPPRRIGLGASLFDAASDLLAGGYGAACLVDADSPTLPTSLLVGAARALALPGDRVVVGGAEDGGYYLIGLKRAHRRLFEDIAWSTDRVLRQTLDRAAEIGLSVHALPVWYDVDDVASLRRLFADLAAPDRDRHIRRRILRRCCSKSPIACEPATHSSPCTAAAVGLLALTGAGLYAQREHGIEAFVAVALAQGGVYALATWLVWRGVGSRDAAALIIGIAVAMRVVVLLAPPYLSSDIYRYVWDGRMIAAGINPYKYVPNDPRLGALRDQEIFPEINRRDYARTIYPPAAQAIFFLVTRVGESLIVMKFAMVGFEAIAVALMLRLLAAAERPASWIAVYLWHPLPLWEFAGSGHIDAAMIALVTLALWSRRLWLTGLALAGGVLVKFYPGLLLPALWRRWDWLMTMVFCMALVSAYVPFAGAGWHVLGFLPSYASEEGFTGGAGFYWWNLARSVVPLGGVSNLPYIFFATCLLAALAGWVAFRRRRPGSDINGAALLAAAFTVLLTPHYPWYFSWLVVFACLVASRALVWLTAASFLLYLVPVWPEVIWNRHRFLVESAVYMPFLILAVGELWRCRRRELASDDKHKAR